MSMESMWLLGVQVLMLLSNQAVMLLGPELDVHLVLVSLDKQRMPSLQKLYLCCLPQFSVEQLKEYVARETQVRAEDIEILLVKNLSYNGLQSTLHTSSSLEDKDVVQVLEGEDL